MGGAVLFNMGAFALLRASNAAPLIKPGSVSGGAGSPEPSCQLGDDCQ